MADGNKPKHIKRRSNCADAWFYVEGKHISVVMEAPEQGLRGICMAVIPLRSILARIPKEKRRGR